MKIFSNFDTRLARTLLDEAKKKYGENNALLLRRGEIYLVIRLWFPLIAWVVSSIWLLRIYYGLLGNTGVYADEIGFVVWGLVLSMFVYLLFLITKKIMNFYMDFVIVSPEQLVAYDQTGVLNRVTRSLELSKIKTINVVTEGRLSSIFNYWSIVFLAEGDAQNGDIKLSFIIDPVDLRNTIYRLMDYGEQLREAEFRRREDD